MWLSPEGAWSICWVAWASFQSPCLTAHALSTEAGRSKHSCTYRTSLTDMIQLCDPEWNDFQKLLYLLGIKFQKPFKGVIFNSLAREREPEPAGKVSCCHWVGYRLRLSFISCLQDAMEPVHFRVVCEFMALSVATSWGQALFFLHDACERTPGLI
uniref:Uncharacterized protein n=1 Tax=Rousettus aegyptiacus TaxID=9407 RepID=A0A7J8G9T5_ROUAE|nr:hypothetical protein HJG63_011482 [Rousettus aegyptiacus]